MSNTDIPKSLGRYEIVRELGRGAMGVVYEGRDPNIGRRVAIKTMRKDVMEASGRAEEMLERFLREAQAAGLLNHPNIITIYDAGEEGDTTYIAMEFVEGSSLRDLLDDKKILDAEEIATLGATICDALAEAHRQGIVHRDIKPDNILLPEHGALKVADFGIARVTNSNLTQDGELIGTPYYMSPEQFMGQKIDGRSDLFSVAVILYEMLTNEKPFMGEALTAMMHNVINTNPIPPQKLNFNIPSVLGEVVMKALSKRPGDRYPDGRAMAQALRECLKPNPDPAKLGLVPDANATVLSSSGLGGATIISDMQVAPMSATATGVPPASSLMDELSQGEASPRDLEETAASSANEKKSPMLAIVGGIVVLIVLVAGGGYFALGGGDSTTGNNNSGVFNTAETSEVTFFIFGTDDFNTQDAFNQIAEYDSGTLAKWKAWENEHIASIDELDGAKITLQHIESGKKIVLNDTTRVPIPKNLKDYRIIASAPGYDEVNYNFQFTGDIPNLYLLLRKQK